MKTLNTIQIISKIGRVLSTIVFICCIVGAAGCVVGMLCIPLAETGAIRIGGTSIRSLAENRSGMELNGLYPLLAGAMIVAIGEAVTAKFAEMYFKRELVAGTPFTASGAKELKRLGILTICVPLGALILAQIVSGVIAGFIDCGEAFNMDGGDSVALGVMFIFMSLICRYGAELEEEKFKA